MNGNSTGRALRAAILAVCAGFALNVSAAPAEPVMSLAAREKAPLLDTLKDLVSIESGSGDREGLDKISELIAVRLRALGGAVEFIEPNPAEIYRMVDTPKQIGRMVHARFTGSGTKKILLIAHMDTVYLRGMLEKQPYRVDGNRAYGLGIADDKQGIAVILHTLAILKAMNFRDYGLVTVLINADEEVSSAGSRTTSSRLRLIVIVEISQERRWTSRLRPMPGETRFPIWPTAVKDSMRPVKEERVFSHESMPF